MVRIKKKCDGTPIAISKYLREEELKKKAKATIEHMKQPHFINKQNNKEIIEKEDGIYEEFADEFYKLCEKYALEDFNGKQVLRICKRIINEFAI